MACVTGYLEMVDSQYFLKNLLTLKIFHYLQHHSLFNIFFILHKSYMSEGKRKFWTNLNISSTQHFSQLIFEITPLYPHTHSIPLFTLLTPLLLFALFTPFHPIWASSLFIFRWNFLYNLACFLRIICHLIVLEYFGKR